MTIKVKSIDKATFLFLSKHGLTIFSQMGAMLLIADQSIPELKTNFGTASMWLTCC